MREWEVRKEKKMKGRQEWEREKGEKMEGVETLLEKIKGDKKEK